MHTRRSPRNQERLWRELGGQPPPKPKRSRLPSREQVRVARQQRYEVEMRDRFQHGMMTKEEEAEALKSFSHI